MNDLNDLSGKFIWYNEEGILTKSNNIYDVKTKGNIAAYKIANGEYIFFIIIEPNNNWIRIFPDAPVVQEFKTRLLLDGVAI